MKFQSPTTLLLLATAVAASFSTIAATKWGYHHDTDSGSKVDVNTDELDPQEWGLVYPSCNGSHQSPIDIETADVQHEARADGCFTMSSDTVGLSFSGECQSFTLQALEDSFHWNVEETSTCAVRVESSGTTYNLAQFHMHMTSEHKVDGVAHAGEVHFVHTDANGGSGKVVIAVFLENVENATSKQSDSLLPLNPWINDVWNSLGKVNQTVQVAYPYADLVGQQILAGSVYNYAGSLTTPPCSEVVDWWVLGSPVYMTSANLESLAQQLETRETADNGDDARPTQPLNGRTVYAY